MSTRSGIQAGTLGKGGKESQTSTCHEKPTKLKLLVGILNPDLSLTPLKEQQNLPDHGFVCSDQAFPLRVLLEEKQSLRSAELVFGYLVEACQILDDAARQQKRWPTLTDRAVDQVDLGIVLVLGDQDIPPFQVVVTEPVIVECPGDTGNLRDDLPGPLPVLH